MSEPYRTLDGSLIEELVRPETHGAAHLSVAVATIAAGQSTLAHFHGRSEEVYYVLQGEGVLLQNGLATDLHPGEAHLIRPGVEHKVVAAGPEPLRILCLCAPPYQHEDTTLTEGVVV
jgi:mannose-6-phosphate isomerase-like protein (cupin superfamily)